DRTISHIKDPLGKLQRLSVAVVVNYRNNDGKPEALPPEELEKLNDLVKQAMGYSVERGDTLSVVNSVFSDDTPASPPAWENPVYLDYAMQLAKYLLIALLVLLVWRKLIKPMMETAAIAKEQTDAEAAEIANNR